MESICNKKLSSIRIQRWWDSHDDDDQQVNNEKRQQALFHMLQIAAHEQNLEDVVNNPVLSCYVVMAGRKDSDLVAAVAQDTYYDNQVIGAAWMQCWKNPTTARGFGFLDINTPEIAIGVLPDYHGQGIGSQLLTELIQIGCERKLSAICLSVREDNSAVRLYERLGFYRVDGSEKVNRVGTTSYIMVRNFSV